MIKMYINNEEVVSNKEFTISEEMLATPSTVLNNCYPALWENTKDYVSKFYFPKDYSKCIIGDGEFEKGSQRNIIKKVSGISPSFETNITKPWESLTIDGNSYQATSTDPVSPSPDYPSEIENVKGKNLFKLDKFTDKVGNGMTMSWNDVSSIILNGTTTSQTNFWFTGLSLKIPAGTYHLSFSYEDKNITYYFKSNNKNIFYGKVGTTQTLKSDVIIDTILIQIDVNKALTNQLIKIQLEKGSGATRYVPYGNIQIVESGENLFDINISEWGKYNVWKHNAGNAEKAFVNVTNIKGLDKCSISFKNNTRTFRFGYQFIDDNENYLSGYYRSAPTNEKIFANISVPENASKIIISQLDGKKEDDIKIQLERDPIATDYKPYTEEVVNIDLKGNELCSLPNGTKDELIVKDGRAKIVKRIGKVVLNGSERSWLENSVTKGLFQITLTNIPIDLTTTRAMSNYFKGINGSAIAPSDNSVCTYRGNRIMFTYKTYAKNINGFKTWLSTHNTIVQYELKEPYEIDLGEVTLPNTLIGQNNVTLDATLETNMEISYYYSSYDLLFAGVVKKTGNISLNPRYPHYADIQVLDFKTFLSEGETLNFVIDNKTIGQAIDMVIDAIKSYGFVKGNIMLDDINEVIGAYSTDKKTAYDVFQYFSDITNSRWFTRMIDEDTVAIDFYDTDKLPVKPKIEYTEDWFCNNLIDDMSYSIKTDDYRNKQILLSDEVFGSTPYNDLLTSNGYDTSYTTTGKIASLTSAKIDGKDATFTTEANKEGGVEADIYYKPGEVGITTNNQIGAGKVIEITYIPLVEGREIIINDEEVNRIGSQLNRNGVISRYENRNDTTSSDELRQIGQTYIKYKGKAEVTLKITSRKNIYDIGDKVQFDAPLEDLSTEYMVKKKTTKYIVTANQLFYDYELSSSFNSESEINYFDNQRSKHKGNLSEGDYITRDIDITNSANIIWHDTSIDEISITGNNILDCALDSPFTD